MQLLCARWMHATKVCVEAGARQKFTKQKLDMFPLVKAGHRTASTPSRRLVSSAEVEAVWRLAGVGGARLCHNKSIKKLLIKLFWARGLVWWALRAGRGQRRWLPVILCQGTSMSLVAAGV